MDTAQSPPTMLSGDVSNIAGKTIRESIDNMLDLFTEHVQAADVVLIEQQPLHHAKMLSLMYALYGAFRQAGKWVEVVSPKLRISYLKLGKVSYAQRKSASVKKAKELYGDSVFEAQGKKHDDLADAILQAIAWMDRKRAS